jgi:single-strand DNA-binding protein
MYETMVTVVGNLVDTPRLRRTGGGVDVANFRVASTARRYDRATGSWADHGTLFLGVSCWRRLGVNVTESLRRGDPVVVTGRLFAREYEVNGQARTSFEIEAHAVGPDLSRGTAVFRRSGTGAAEPHAAGAGGDRPGPDRQGRDAGPPGGSGSLEDGGAAGEVPAGEAVRSAA